MSSIIISPLGLVPKAKNGEFRLIFDLSFAQNKSLNKDVPQEVCSVQYKHFDAVTEMVKRLGRGVHLAKADIKSASRLLPGHSDDFCRLPRDVRRRRLLC